MAMKRVKASDDESLVKKKIDKEGLSRVLKIFSFAKSYRTTLIIGVVFLILSSSTTLLFPYLAGKLIDASVGKSDFEFKDLNSIAILLIVVLVFQSIFSFCRIYLFSIVTENTLSEIRKKLYDKMLTLPIQFYEKNRVGELMSRITSDVTLLHEVFSTSLAEFLRQISILIIGITVIMYTSPKLSLFLLATIPVLAIFGIIFGKNIRKVSKSTQDEMAKTSIVVEETLQAIHTVKAFTKENFENKRYSERLTILVQNALKASALRGFLVSMVIFVIFGGIVLVLWFGSLMVQNGELTIGQLSSFIIYTSFIGASVGGLGDMYGLIQKTIGSSDRILEILDEKSENVFFNQGTKEIQEVENITFNQVSFAYPTRKDKVILNKIDFTIQKNSKVAIIGKSGVGKSTIISLILGNYILDHGQIEINGENIKDLDLLAYRKNIAIVPQEVILFGGSIKENIAYGKDGEATDEEIMEAARKSHSLEFINSFTDGFDTLVGDRGIKLSGGQRQRIAIARAILRNPSLLILDEATSALDSESEHLVQMGLEELMKNRTTIIIAHRLATISKADNIIVMSHGSVAEQGSHQQLMQNKQGLYHKYIELQQNSLLTDVEI